METINARKNEEWIGAFVWVLMAVLLSLLVAKIFFANQLATTGAVSSAHSYQLKLLKSENQKLQNEVSLLGSIAQVSEKADKAGLKKSPKLEVLPKNTSIALRQ